VNWRPLSVFMISGRANLPTVPTQNHAAQLVFYMLDN
jgi:hypothetical protein